ncbi:hypothetical protein A2619_03670 [candidate division WWE3 bacterium RIFOXYD1_FULL_39_9]|uniref:6-carboxy-5,6,7,8-tetrahydropterin synthase n=1 Tax=candidate division WWE3 bacterium RIFOXYD1_FULL_39_9 TaxID=1802649 RepID=A0A1F4X864_UNCKA|nr:MAG: hypothetical protein A2619_03670 [candidate division WWE3 bacterium RIFOXYD1_FULL_39_9]
MIVSRQVEWDMGHRVMNHHSKCRNVHGHRYKLEAFLSGELVTKEADSSEGMVIDFGDVKSVLLEHVHDVLDHGFLVWEKDLMMMNFFKKNPDMKHIVVPFTSTAENLAAWIFKNLESQFNNLYGKNLRLEEIYLWETPTSKVVCKRGDIK